MSKFICTQKCTYGDPPRFYDEGEPMFADIEEAPKHFKKADAGAPAVIEKTNPEAGDEGKTLGEGAPGTATTAETAAQKTASEPCTVKELAAELQMDVQEVKEASGKTRQDAALTSEEVDAVKTALKKTNPEAGAEDEPGSAASEE